MPQNATNSQGTSHDDPSPSLSDEIGNIIDIAQEHKLTTFIAQPDQPFVWMPDGEAFPLRSRRFLAWLADIYWEFNGGAPAKRAVDQALLILENEAWDRQERRLALDASNLVTMILAAAEQRGEWVGSALKLFRELKDRARPEALEDFPRTPAALGRQLARLTPALRQAGYELEQSRSSRSRSWSIRRVTTAEVVNVRTLTATPGGDGMTAGDISLTVADLESVIARPFYQKGVQAGGDGMTAGGGPSTPGASEGPEPEVAEETVEEFRAQEEERDGEEGRP